MTSKEIQRNSMSSNGSKGKSQTIINPRRSNLWLVQAVGLRRDGKASFMHPPPRPRSPHQTKGDSRITYGQRISKSTNLTLSLNNPKTKPQFSNLARIKKERSKMQRIRSKTNRQRHCTIGNPKVELPTSLIAILKRNASSYRVIVTNNLIIWRVWKIGEQKKPAVK